MKLTPIILLLPVASFYFAWSEAIGVAAMLTLWILSIVVCLGWGVYVSRQSRLLGWLCVVVALIQLFIMLMPVTARAKVRGEIFEYETFVA